MATWKADILAGFEQTTLALPDADDGPVEIVIVRKNPASSKAAVLYIHGFVDYVFQSHLADFYNSQGLGFYGVDLRRHGRSLRPHQLPNYTRDIDEYLADVDAVVSFLTSNEGITWLLLNGHSTGGLVGALYAHRGANKDRISAVFLNSPFLDMNLPGWQERALEPILAQLGKVAPELPLSALSPVYGQSLHISGKGENDFNLEWKPIEGFPARAGWFGAIHKAQEEIEEGLDIKVPVLVLHAGSSANPTEWTDEAFKNVGWGF
ncbi:alpha/beta hydrolase fold family protein [Hyaloraphidium curvatum]|nr:alpha/beta hydrolase fold family protein [Hyaloraphidium curvatum]